MRQGVGAGVEAMIIRRFVDAHSPQDDGRMVPVTPNHSAYIVNRKILPWLVPNVLPARDLFKHQKPKFIAGIKKMRRLRVVGGADDIAFEFLLENLSITPLRSSRHGLT